VQQEKHGRVFRTRLSVEDGEPIDLCGAIKSQASAFLAALARCWLKNSNVNAQACLAATAL